MTDGIATSVLTAFYVVVDENGVVSVHGESIPSVVVKHTATLADVETYAAAASKMAGRVLQAQMLQPPVEPTPAQRVAEAFTKRAEDIDRLVSED
jgi:hypothetical protein